MACRGCANLQCNCFTKSSESIIASGNGSQYAPFTFRPDYVPYPRPFGHIYGKTDQSLDGAPYSLFEAISADVLDQGGNMNVGNRTSLVVPADGIYLVGTTIPFDSVMTDGLNDNFSLRRNGVQVSTGTWAHAAASHVAVMFMCTTTLLDLNTGDVLDVYIERVAGAGTVTVDYNVTTNFTAHPHLWAVWMGGPI